LNQSDDIGKSDHVLGKRRNDDEEGSYQEGYTTPPNIDEDNTSDIPDMPDISEEIDGGDQSSGTIYNDPRDVSLSLISIMEEYFVNVEYHKELDSIFDYLFGQQKGRRSTIKNIHQARTQWKNLRNIEPPEYKEEFSYDKDDWEKILWWIEWAVGR
ncbi:5157_t:CDS:2, partial [Funneliformis geosporum]